MQRSNLLHVVVGMGRNVTSWVSGPESPASGYPLPALEKNRTPEFPLKFDPSRCQRGFLLPLSWTCYTRPLEPWPTGTPPGNGARNRSFPEELFKSARK